jgi:hypothetical protein
MRNNFGVPEVRLDERKGHFEPAMVCFEFWSFCDIFRYF